MKMLGIACLLAGMTLALAACGSDDEAAPGTEPTITTETATTEPTTTEATTETTTTEPTTTTETPPPPPPAETIRIVVEGGVPKGGIVRRTIDKGNRVVLVVTSDVRDHVHLHGYDVMRDVAPGKRARIAFRATVPGRFEVELEDRGVQIADLTVKP